MMNGGFHMTKPEKIAKTGDEQCICEECCAQIPTSAAVTAEGVDYVHHFCGQACYEKWQAKQQEEKKHHDE